MKHKNIAIFFTLFFVQFGFAQNVGIGTTTPVAMLHVADSNVLFTGPGFVPSSTIYYPPAQGQGIRMMWYPQKAAFRVGYAFDTEWDFGNIGRCSFASGYGTKAYNDYSTALGIGTSAMGQSSIAMGDGSKAMGSSSTAMGVGTTASTFASTAMGWGTIASGSVATAMGVGSIASGGVSTAMGNYTTAKSYAETSFGSYNTDYIPLSSGNWNSLDRLFVIGNGTTSTTKSDAMVILKNGNIGIGTSLPIARLHVADSAVLFTGPATVPASTTYPPPAQGAGTRMMWYPQKAAFRVGATSSNEWDFYNIGKFSFASGFSGTASGDISTVMGRGYASGYVSTAMGGGYASGYYSTAMGEGTALGNYSTAIGIISTAKSFAETSIGSYNTDYTPLSISTWNATDRLFGIGNGTSASSKSDAMIVLKNGNVGIGISNPLAALDVQSTTALARVNSTSSWSQIQIGSPANQYAYLTFAEDNNVKWTLAKNDASDFYIAEPGPIQRITIKKITGNVGIGTSTPNAPLQFANSVSNRKVVLYEAANNDHQFNGFGLNPGALRFQVNNTGDDFVYYAGTSSTTSNEVMRVKGNGNVGINKTNPSYKLDVVGDINASGLVRANGIALSSDARFKQNIITLPNALNNLLQLRGTNYFFNTQAFPDKKFSTDKQMGVVAQEVEKIYPELVTTDKEGYKSVNYIGLIPLMIESIKEQQKQIEIEKRQIEKQQQQIEKLTQIVNQLINK